MSERITLFADRAPPLPVGRYTLRVESEARVDGVVQGELEAYGAGLEDKPQLLVLNKGDLLGPELMEDVASQLREAAGIDRIFLISGATGEGVKPMLDAVLPILDADKQESEADEPEAASDSGEEKPWSPI